MEEKIQEPQKPQTKGRREYISVYITNKRTVEAVKKFMTETALTVEDIKSLVTHFLTLLGDERVIKKFKEKMGEEIQKGQVINNRELAKKLIEEILTKV